MTVILLTTYIFIVKIGLLPKVGNFYFQAPVVQWIEHQTSNLDMRVRFPPGAPERKSQRVLVRLAEFIPLLAGLGD